MPPRNVLIIADLETENPRVRALLAPESSPCGTHVLRAASGNAAFALLASTSFDTVLADPTLLSGSAAGLATVELLRHKRSQGLDLVWVRG